MIIITDVTDIFSSNVENWLKQKGKKCFRINVEEPVDHFYFELKNNDIKIVLSRKNDQSELLISNSNIWHRRGRLTFDIPFKPGEIDPQIYYFLHDEASKLSNAVLMCLEAKGLLTGKHIVEKGNKLFNLFLATNCGFKVPDTFVINRKNKLQQISKQYPNLITKPISDNFFNKVNGFNLEGTVNDFNISCCESLPETFFPMLFQKKIDRAFEVRSFFFCGEIFSMATFLSKEDANTPDIKAITLSKKRFVPYNLPSDIKENVLTLVSKLNLDSASFDFIVDKKGNTFFLELNQYGMLNNMSYNCNYTIEEFVANKLMENERKVY